MRAEENSEVRIYHQLREVEYLGEQGFEQRVQVYLQLWLLRGEIGMDSAGSYVPRDGLSLEVLVSAKSLLLQDQLRLGQLALLQQFSGADSPLCC